MVTRYRRVVLAVIGGLLMSLALVATASAKTAVLNLDEGIGKGSLSPGSEVRIITERPVVFESTSGTVTCPDQSDFTAFYGHLVSNDTTKDEISLESGGFMFGEGCSSTSPLGASAEVEPLDLPWKVGIRPSGVVNITGTPEVAVAITFSGSPSHRCVYERTTVKAALNPKPVPGNEQQAEIDVIHRKLLRNAGDSPLCPRTVNMTAEFPEVVGATEYIYDSLR